MLRRPSTTKLVTIIAVLAVVAGGAVAVTRTSVFRSTAAPQAPAATAADRYRGSFSPKP